MGGGGGDKRGRKGAKLKEFVGNERKKKRARQTEKDRGKSENPRGCHEPKERNPVDRKDEKGGGGGEQMTNYKSKEKKGREKKKRGKEEKTTKKNRGNKEESSHIKGGGFIKGEMDRKQEIFIEKRKEKPKIKFMSKHNLRKRRKTGEVEKHS